MASIKLSDEFTIELTDAEGKESVLKGTVRELTKSEKKEFSWLSDRVKEVQRISYITTSNERQIELLNTKLLTCEDKDRDSIIKLLQDLEKEQLEMNLKVMSMSDDIDNEDIVQKRLETTIGGLDKEAILAIGESITYSKLLTLIAEAVQKDYEKK